MEDLHLELFETLSARYEPLDVLGVGGMGTVYLALDTRHGRRVAIKSIRPDMTTEAVRRRFQREITITARLQHPHILPLLDSGIVGDTLYYIMPYVEGESLEKRLKREGPLPAEEVVRIARDVLEGLAHAHRQGVVHRDIKPGNVMLTPGYALILDFGIAKALAGAGVVDELSTGAGWIGTPSYMAPEQFHGVASPRSDLYALGAVMFEALAGRPWPSEARRDEADWSRVDPSLASITRRALAPLPKARWPDAESLGEVLRKWELERALEAAGSLGGTRSPSLLSRIRGALGRWRAKAPPARSVAVLPLQNLNRDEETEYFSDGITEDIITQLSKIRDLRVISRTSVMRYKNSEAPVRDIGRALNVATVLEGSVRRGDGRVRIVSQLIDARTDRHLWGETYDRDLTDIFAIQAEVARKIAEALDAQLSTRERQRVDASPTRNLRAYDLYLKSRMEWNRRTEASLARSVQLLEEAVEADPDFGLAFAALADVHVTLGLYGVKAPDDVMPRARAAAEKALELDSGQAEAFAALGSVQSLFDWNWTAAEASYRKAIALGPGYPVAHQWYAMHVLMPAGRFAEAEGALSRARELDPLAPAIATSVALIEYYRLRFGRAVSAFRSVIRENPDFWLAYYFLGWSLLEEGHDAEAVTALQIARHLSDGSVAAVAGLGYAFAATGQTSEARRILAELEARAERAYVSPLRVAQVLVALGEEEKALDWLDRAVEGRDIGLALIDRQRGFESLRGNDRYEEIRRRVLGSWYDDATSSRRPPPRSS